MNCPACDEELTTIQIAMVQVDICDGGCGGIWFDQFEFKKFDEPHEFAGEKLLEIEAASSSGVDHGDSRGCVRCDEAKMLRRFYSPKQQIEIDECPMCGGIWLDYGELNKIREMFNTDEERRKYSQKFLADEFSEELDKFFAESAKKTAQVDRFANMFFFLYPSWYLPGKQKWGKF